MYVNINTIFFVPNSKKEDSLGAAFINLQSNKKEHFGHHPRALFRGFYISNANSAFNFVFAICLPFVGLLEHPQSWFFLNPARFFEAIFSTYFVFHWIYVQLVILPILAWMCYYRWNVHIWIIYLFTPKNEAISSYNSIVIEACFLPVQ